MTTCVVSVNPFRDPLMMGVNPRQNYQEQKEKVMNGGLMDLKQVHDNSYWLPLSARAHPTATDRPSRSPLRALLQQPPPLSLVPDTSSESDTIHNGVIQSSWPPFPEQANFQSPKVRSLRDSSSDSGQQSPQYNSCHQFGDQGVDLQQPTSNNYHVHHPNRSERRQQLPVAGNLSSSQEQSGLDQQLHDRRVLQRMTIHELSSVARRMGSSLPKELEKMQMMAVAQQQMNKIRLKRRKSFDQDKQLSLPEGAGGSKLKFGCTADGIRNGPDNHSVLHSQQRQQQQQSEAFPRGFLSPANQIHDQDVNTSNRGSPRSTLSTEAKIHVEDAEAMVMKQFQERVSQLDIGTRLSLQESLYRLARNARERQEKTRASSGNSAENEYHAAATDMDCDSCSDRPASVTHSRVPVETQTNPTDWTLMSMMSSPSRVPGLQNPCTEHGPPSLTRPRSVAARSSQVSCPVNWSWPISTSSKSSNWGAPGDPADSGNMVHTQFHGRDGSGAAALEAPTSRSPLSSHTTWTGSPQLTEYSSPAGSSSRTSPGIGPSNASVFDHRQAADINLTYRGSVGAVPQTGRQLVGNRSTASQAMDIRAPRRCDSNSSISTDHSYSSSPGKQVLQQHFGNVGSYHAPPNYNSSQEGGGGSFLSDGQHTELASANQGSVDEHSTFKGPSSQNFAMMNPNEDILGAARSIQSRSTASAVDHRQDVHPFHRQRTSSPSHNSNAAKNVTVCFSSLRYDDRESPFESREEARGRNLGNISCSTSTGVGIFDQSLTTTNVLRNMVDTAAYTRPCSEFFQS